MEHCKLLIIDYQSADRANYRRLLSQIPGTHYAIVEVQTVDEACQELARLQPDCVLLDYGLPGSSGPELLKKLTHSGDASAPPVVVLSDQPDERVAVEAMKQGALDYLAKQDLSGESLRRAIHNAIEKFQLRKTVERQSQELKVLYAEERERRAQLEQRIGERDKFLAMLAHELRNPLGAMVMAAQLMRCDSSPLQHAMALDVISRQGEHMARMLDELLDVARITQGKIQLRKQALTVSDVVEHAVASSRPWIEAGGHTLSVSPVDAAWQVEADSTRLDQVLVNLLKNAAKYTPPGGKIDLRVWTEPGQITFCVQDDGVGVPQEMQIAIFEPFVQTDRTADRSQGGLGLGLAIVRTLVEMHGGSVTLHSSGAGRGCEFVVRLPLGNVPAASADGQCDGRAADRDVLIIEDSPDAREMLRQLIQKLGHRVKVAEDGQRGFEAIQQHRFDVALVDIGLPILDGYQVARRVRALPNHHLTLIAVTGYGNSEDRRQALEAGFDAHVVKPVNLEKLAELINASRA